MQHSNPFVVLVTEDNNFFVQRKKDDPKTDHNKHYVMAFDNRTASVL
jgi:hypothetical protein